MKKRMVYRSTYSQRICLLSTETPIPMLISHRSSTQLISLLSRCVDRTVHQNGTRHIEQKWKMDSGATQYTKIPIRANIHNNSISVIRFPVFTANTCKLKVLRKHICLGSKFPVWAPVLYGLCEQPHLPAAVSTITEPWRWGGGVRWMFALAVTDEGCSIKQTFMATPQDMQLSYSKHQTCMFILLTQAPTIAET